MRRPMGRVERGQRTGTPADLVVVGLGNPGEEYAGSRHNVGFEVVDLLASRWGGRLRKSKERALVDEVRSPSMKRVALVEPQTYMNASGDAVAPLVRRFGIEADLSKLVIVHDELDLPVGKIKVKFGGGLAGHNGLRSIRASLRVDAFTRIRIGVGKPPSKEAGVDHVLKKIGKRDREILTEIVVHAADAVEVLLDQGLDAAMNRFNTIDLTPPPPPTRL